MLIAAERQGRRKERWGLPKVRRGPTITRAILGFPSVGLRR